MLLAILTGRAVRMTRFDQSGDCYNTATVDLLKWSQANGVSRFRNRHGGDNRASYASPQEALRAVRRGEQVTPVGIGGVFFG